MTNRLFIVKYVFVDVDVDKNVDDEVNALFRNSSIESDNREDFDDIINFDAIFAQNICFFDVAKSVANKINSMKVDKIDSTKFFDEVKNEVNDEVTSDFEDKLSSLDRNETI